MKYMSIFVFVLIKLLTKIEAYKMIYDVDISAKGNPTNWKSSFNSHDPRYLMDPVDILKDSSWLDTQYLDERSSLLKAYDDFSLSKILNQPIFDENFVEPREQETETHSSLVGGHQYVSGGAGEGKQHLMPEGIIDNKEQVKTDEDLPAYCDPPNPCPIGYVGEDCDPRHFSEFTAQFSKNYQEQQNCMCDQDHNECSKTAKPKSVEKINRLLENIKDLTIKNNKGISEVVAKKSPRVKRSED